jgi:ribosomal protein S6
VVVTFKKGTQTAYDINNSRQHGVYHSMYTTSETNLRQKLPKIFSVL